MITRRRSSGDGFSTPAEGRRVKSYRVCDGNAPQYLIVNVGAGEFGGRNVYGSASQVKVDWVRVWGEKA